MEAYNEGTSFFESFLMVTFSHIEDLEINKSRWRFAKVLFDNDSNRLSIICGHVSWIVKPEVITSIERVEKRMDCFLKLSLNSGRSIIFYGPAHTLLLLGNLLSKITSSGSYEQAERPNTKLLGRV